MAIKDAVVSVFVEKLPWEEELEYSTFVVTVIAAPHSRNVEHLKREDKLNCD